MKAFAELGQNDKVNGQSHGQKNEPNTGRLRPDTLFARLRRLERRCDILESKLSALRRDHDRVERANYRAKETPSVQTEALPVGAGMPEDSLLFH